MVAVAEPAALRKLLVTDFLAMAFFFGAAVSMLLEEIMTFFPLTVSFEANSASFKIMLAFLVPSPILVVLTGEGRLLVMAGDRRARMGEALVGDSDSLIGEIEGEMAYGSGVEVPETVLGGATSQTAGCFGLVCGLLRKLGLFPVEDAAEVAAIMASTFLRKDSSLSVRRNTVNFSSLSSVSTPAAAVDWERVLEVTEEETIEDSRTVAKGPAVCVSNSTYVPECSPDRRRRRSPKVASSRSKTSSSVSSRSGRRASADLPIVVGDCLPGLEMPVFPLVCDLAFRRATRDLVSRPTTGMFSLSSLNEKYEVTLAGLFAAVESVRIESLTTADLFVFVTGFLGFLAVVVLVDAVAVVVLRRRGMLDVMVLAGRDGRGAEDLIGDISISRPVLSGGCRA